MYKFLIIICLIYLINHYGSCDILINRYEEKSQRLLVTDCVLKILDKSYKNSLESGIIATLLDEQVEKFAENLILERIFRENKWSILNFKRINNGTKYPMYSFIDMYLVKIKDIDEIKDNLQFLTSKYWNPTAKIIIFAEKYIENKELVNKIVFETLWKQKALDSIVLLPHNETENVIDVYAWFPYHFGNCGNYDHATSMDTCVNGSYRFVLNFLVGLVIA